MVNLGIIGAGDWGKNHVRVCANLNEITSLSLADLNQEVLKKNKETYEKINKISTDYKELLKDIDAAIVITPSNTHYEIAKNLLNAGKDVFVEKPLTLNSKEALDLIKIAEKNKKLIMVGHIFRYNKGFLKLKSMADKKEFGEIKLLFGQRMNFRAPRRDMGVLFTYATHDLDLFTYLLGEMPKTVFCDAKSMYGTSFEDMACVSLNFKNCLANVDVGWCFPKKIRNLWLLGTEKSAYLDYLTQDIEIYEPKDDGYQYTIKTEFEEPLEIEIKHFIDCVKTRKNPITDGKVGLNAVLLVEAALKSYKENKLINFDEYAKQNTSL